MASSNQLTPHQKLSLGVFLVIGMVTLVFAMARFQKSLTQPFYRPKSSLVFKSDEDLEKERIETLKGEDTDRDTVNDYDELYVFRTSPFLDDSDSDGYKDGDEIAQGFDPNCPKGKTCREPSGSSSDTGTAIATAPPGAVVAPTPTPAPADGGTATSLEEAELLRVIEDTFGKLETLTPEKITQQLKTMASPELRAFLSKIGVPKAALDKADDATLRQLLQETLEEVSATSQSTPTQ